MHASVSRFYETLASIFSGRPQFATARKSWLFSDTEAGAKASAMVYSLMLTCRACGVEPHAWLLHVLTELPQRAPDADISDLLPFNYAKRQAEAHVS